MPRKPRPSSGRPAHRPPKPEGAGCKINLYLCAAELAWVRAQPEGISRTIARLIRQEIDRSELV